MRTYELDAAGRKVYLEHLKEDVLSLLASGAKLSKLATEYGFTAQTINNWRAKARASRAATATPAELSTQAKVELIAKLRADLRRNEMREDILTKAWRS